MWTYATDTVSFASVAYPPGAAAPVPAQPSPQSDVMQWARRVVEKVRAAYGTGRFRWLPWLDPYTEETDEVRGHYRVMMREPILKSALATKVLAVASLDAQVHPADADDPRHKEAAEFVRYALRKIAGGTRGIAWNVLMAGLVDGHSVCEKVWHRAPERWGKYAGKRCWQALKGKDTERLRLVTDEYRTVTGIRPVAQNVGDTFDPRDFVVWAHWSLFESPAGISDFRAPYRAFWIKSMVWQLRGLQLEKYSSPYLKGTYTTYEQKAALELALEEAKSSTWVTVPTGVLVEAIDMSGRANDDFAKAIDDCNKEMLIGTVGAHLQILEGQVSDARGDTSVHKEISELLQWMLASQLGDVVTNQMVKELTEINYSGVEPPTVTWGSVSEQAMQARLAVDTGLQQLGMKLSKREAYAYYGRSEPADEDDVLAPAQPPGGPPGGGQGGMPFGDDGAPPQPLPPPRPPPPPAPEGFADDGDRDLAPAGEDGQAAADLLKNSVRQGVRAFAEVTRAAVARLLKSGNVTGATSLYTEEEKARLAESLAATNATAELLGRTRVRERQADAREKMSARARGIRFTERPAFHTFADEPPVVPLPPEKALDYFRGLIPDVGGDPQTFGADQRRRAFTLAESSDQVVLERVKGVVQRSLESGDGAAQDVAAVLDAAGVSPSSPQYAEMVFRTNCLDAYNTGAFDEMQAVADDFPVWQYVGVRDGRQGADHEPHFDRYYPADVPFARVRGKRVFNCRCTFIPIDADEWQLLQARGATVSQFAEAFAEGGLCRCAGCRQPMQVERFCKEGKNKGKPGPCPKEDGDDTAAAPAKKPAAKKEPAAKAKKEPAKPKDDAKAQAKAKLDAAKKEYATAKQESAAARKEKAAADKEVKAKKAAANKAGAAAMKTQNALGKGGAAVAAAQAKVKQAKTPAQKAKAKAALEAAAAKQKVNAKANNAAQKEFGKAADAYAEASSKAGAAGDKVTAAQAKEADALGAIGAAKAAALAPAAAPATAPAPAPAPAPKKPAATKPSAGPKIKKETVTYTQADTDSALAKTKDVMAQAVLSIQNGLDKSSAAMVASSSMPKLTPAESAALYAHYGLEADKHILTDLVQTVADKVAQVQGQQQAKAAGISPTPQGGPGPYANPAHNTVHAELSKMGITPIEAITNPQKKAQLVASLQAQGFSHASVSMHLEDMHQSLKANAKSDTGKLQPPGFSKHGTSNGPNPTLPDATRPKLTEAEAASVQAYTGPAYDSINGQLRADGTVTGQYEQTHKNIEAAMAKAPKIDPPVNVVRGLKFDSPQQVQAYLAQFIHAHQTGEPVHMAGYNSTTVGDKTMPNFTGQVELRIAATHGLDVLPYTHYTHEKELLLPHNAQVRVKSITKDPATGRHVVELEQVHPQDQTTAPPPPKPKKKGWISLW